jgi:sec-independent protein translocase protein TatA
LTGKGARKEIVMKLLLFVIGTEWIIVLVVAAILLLFGGTKLPQLARALGQSKKAFKEGIDEGERPPTERAKLDTVEDEALFDEARRRAQQIRADESKKIQ